MSEPTKSTLAETIAAALRAEADRGRLDHVTDRLGQPDALKEKLCEAARGAAENMAKSA